ncbi:hypothetical protein G3I76_77600, partial [Streptomyces sp. SID11233]|nr:hypothetical protein [Streptomyces sp. SID11233]
GDLKGKAVKNGENLIPPISTGCYERDAKHARCEGELFIDPHPAKYSVDSNSDATTWKTAIGLQLFTKNGQLKTGETETRPYTVQLKRAAKTTTNATPE